MPDVRATQVAREVVVTPSDSKAEVAQMYLDAAVMPDGGMIFTQQVIEIVHNLPSYSLVEDEIVFAGTWTLSRTENEWVNLRVKKLIYLVELTLRYADGGSIATETLYLSNHAFNTYADETPADTEYIAVLRDSDIPSFKQELSEALYGIAIPSFGRLIINNADGYFDNKLFPNRVWEGGDIVVKLTGDRCDVSLDLAMTIFTGVMGKMTYSDNVISVEIFSSAIKLQKKNIPEDTFEGPNQEVVPAQIAYGYVNNVSPILIDAVELTYKVAGHPITAITAVYDRGVALTAGSQYSTDLTNATFTLNQNPDGQITCDIQGKAIGGSFSANRMDFIYDLLITYGEISPADVDGSAYNTARLTASMSGDSGFYIDNETSILAVIEELLRPVLGFLYFSRTGVATMGRFEIPETGTVIALELDSSEIFSHGNATSDSGATGDVIIASQVDRLYAKAVMLYNHNFTVQNEGELGAADPVNPDTESGQMRIAWLKDESLRTEQVNDGPTTGRNLYVNAEDMEPIESWFINKSDADVAARYWLDIYGVARFLVSIECTVAPLQTTLHNVITIKYFIKDETSGDNKTLTRFFNERRMRSVAYEENYGENIVSMLLFI